MRREISALLILSLTWFSSCSRPQQLPPTAYIHYMEDPANGYRKEVKAGITTYNIQLATPKYMALKEVYSRTIPGSEAAVLNRAKEMSGYIFFLINITRKDADEGIIEKNINRKELNNRMINYYSAANNDLILMNGKEPLLPATYHFEDNYGLSPYNTIVAAYKLVDEKEVDRLSYQQDDIQLVFNDRFAANPFIKAGFSKRMIEQLPSLNFNK